MFRCLKNISYNSRMTFIHINAHCTQSLPYISVEPNRGGVVICVFSVQSFRSFARCLCVRVKITRPGKMGFGIDIVADSLCASLIKFCSVLNERSFKIEAFLLSYCMHTYSLCARETERMRDRGAYLDVRVHFC